MTRADRRDLGWLGLMLLIFGFALAPLLHRVAHAGDHSHGPSAPEPGRHGEGSLEHLTAALHATPAVPAPTFLLAHLTPRASPTRHEPGLEARRATSQPQGP